MATSSHPGSPLEVQLPDGNRLTVALDLDGDATEETETELAMAIVLAGDQEAEVEAAVVEFVEASGLTVTTSTRRRAKVIVVR
jgi:hypothetical protein